MVLEVGERLEQCSVTFLYGGVEAVVGRHLSRQLPHPFNGVELRRVSREARQFDEVRVLT